MTAERRRVVLDECLRPRLTRAVAERGYDVTSLQQLGWKGLKDPVLLARLSDDPTPSVLVTMDRAMLFEHVEELAEAEVALAILRPTKGAEGVELLHQEADILHRHLHRIVGQDATSRVRYTAGGSSKVRAAGMTRAAR